MYSNKDNVNILTALLVKHGIGHVVVCPGSRNAPLVHNFTVCPDLECHTVTDERSAGFYALGMCQALDEAVAVCVTSGSALLNLVPAVAEAYYQHLPLVVVSADRPQEWIGQLDGQTLPQPDALGRFVRKAVSLPEPHNDEERWYANRLVNEALMEGIGPVHINVPISEPLFDFSVTQLPDERKITIDPLSVGDEVLDELSRRFMQARQPMLVVAQAYDYSTDEVMFAFGDDKRYVPDFVVYISKNGSVVSKRLKRFLRGAGEVWAVNETGEVNDTFMNLTRVVRCKTDKVEKMLKECQKRRPSALDPLYRRVEEKKRAFIPPFSQMAAVRLFEEERRSMPDSICHYANSTAIRLANIYSERYVYCNRGVNGIEGSMSTAAGFSLVTDKKVFCVIGDLSFFYDSNALWNSLLSGNFRIMLLNNGGGGIFRQLPIGDGRSSAINSVMACHSASAKGVCESYGIEYLSARNMDELQARLPEMMNKDSLRPVLLEVFTDSVEDAKIYNEYYKSLKI